MKKKKYLYIFSYIIFIIIITTLNMLSVTDVLNKRLNLKLVANPVIFLLLDGIFLALFMKKLKKEPYLLQQRVLAYFKTTNNIFLLIALIYSCSFFSIIFNLLGNIILVYLLRPMTVDPNEGNGVVEYFEKYPDKSHHRFYKNVNEIKKDYDPLKKEIEVEVPVLDVEIKDKKKNNRKKIISTVVPIIVISLFVIGTIFSIIEVYKTFERAKYYYYDVMLNDEVIEIAYEERFSKVVIPVVYTQSEYDYFYTNSETRNIINEIEPQENYILELKTYQCRNNDKGNNVIISCGQEALSETREEISHQANKMEIMYNGKTIYEGDYIKDVTKYLIEPGTYTFIIKDKINSISTEINFKLEIIPEFIQN